MLGDSADLNPGCAIGQPCQWRGEACAIDECGISPAYPGYAASPQADGTVKIYANQWNDLTTYMTAMQNFQLCEVSRRY